MRLSGGGFWIDVGYVGRVIFDDMEAGDPGSYHTADLPEAAGLPFSTCGVKNPETVPEHPA